MQNLLKHQLKYFRSDNAKKGSFIEFKMIVSRVRNFKHISELSLLFYISNKFQEFVCLFFQMQHSAHSFPGAFDFPPHLFVSCSYKQEVTPATHHHVLLLTQHEHDQALHLPLRQGHLHHQGARTTKYVSSDCWSRILKQ